MATKPPEWFEKRLRDLGGVNLFAQPNLRVVFAPDVRHEFGVAQGMWKYPDPTNTSRPLECWVLETWMSPDIFAADWNEELLGPMPREGYYGFVNFLIMPLKNGTVISLDLTEDVFQSLAKKFYADRKWAEGTELERYLAMQARQKEIERTREEETDKKADDIIDNINAHEEEINNAMNRVFSLPKHLEVNVKNSKSAVQA